MANWIETELKLLLPDAVAHRRVLSALGPGRSLVQQNHFFDRADGAFRAARIGVRLRAENDERLLTLKGDALESGGDPALSRRIELETDMPTETFEAALRDGLDLGPWLALFRGEAGKPSGVERERPPPAVARFLDRLESIGRDERLRCYGRFRNLRLLEGLVLHDEQGMIEVEIAVDRTELPGDRIDYEVEVELPGNPGDSDELVERTARALYRWLADRGVGAVVPAPSKLARFQDALARQGGPAGSRPAAEN